MADGRSGSTGSRDPAAIQREIEATRANLAQTLDQLADRTSPKKVASRAAHTLTSTPRGQAVLYGTAAVIVGYVALKVVASRRVRHRRGRR